jgi:thiol:disulfide interchange protein DsbD
MTRNLNSMLILVALTAFSAVSADSPHVTWSLGEHPTQATRGETIQVQLKGSIAEGLHTYSTRVYTEEEAFTSPTSIAVEPESLTKISGKITYSAPKIVKDLATDKEIVEVFYGSVTFTVPLKIEAAAPTGDSTVKLKITSTVCNEQNCFPPVTDVLDLKLNIKDAPAAVSASIPQKTDSKSQGSSSEINKARREGLWSYLQVSMLAGLGALFTPCVFPMVPITVSFFTKRKQTTRARSIRDAAVFSLGIIGTFTVLGFLFALLFGATSISRFATDPYVNLGFAALVMFFALNLFGVFEIQIPSFILNKLNASSAQGEGLVSVLLMGLLFSLTSFTCTGPFIGVTLVQAAAGDWVWPLVGMVGFSTIFAAPFFVLALFPAAMKSLPKSGGWLNSVKVVLGFIEVAFAMKFVSGADLVWRWGFVTREVFLCIWIALALLTTVYLLGRFQLTHDTPVEKVGGVRVLFAASFLSASVWLATGLLGRPLGPLEFYLPPAEYPGSENAVAASHGSGTGTNASESGKLTWIMNWEDALAEARKTNTPLFVDFTGYTCTNCNFNERKVFPQPEIATLLAKFVRARLYTDDQKDTKAKEQSLRYLQMQQDRFKTTALPLYVVITPDDKEIGQYSGIITNPKDFESFLVTTYAKSSENKPVASQ